jgi:hypothetical protein
MKAILAVVPAVPAVLGNPLVVLGHFSATTKCLYSQAKYLYTVGTGTIFLTPKSFHFSQNILL